MDLDLSGSSMSFLRAEGPDISVEEVWQDIQPRSSSSSSDASSAQQVEDRARFIALQAYCANISTFHRKGLPSTMNTGASSTLIMKPICFERELIQAPIVTGLEIVPWCPVHHAIALQLWPNIVAARRHAAHQQSDPAASQIIHLEHVSHAGPEDSSPVEFEFQTEEIRPSPPLPRG